jgi:hypothetical protein
VDLIVQGDPAPTVTVELVLYDRPDAPSPGMEVYLSSARCPVPIFVGYAERMGSRRLWYSLLDRAVYGVGW